jgi:D-glycero-alpha-D-manno-heptose-7-phosphate kinase
MFISAAIDKYIYITYHQSQFDPSIRLRYSRMEEVNTVDEIQHDIIRETFRQYGIKERVELTSHAEIPSGTGLGSSGSFGVGILHAITGVSDKMQLAIRSTEIQMDILKHPIGVQDQYASAFGGVNMYEVDTAGYVKVTPIVPPEGLCLFYTGIKRDANDVLRASGDAGLDKIQELSWETKKCLESGDFRGYGEILNEHWEAKKKRGPMTSAKIDSWYELALKNGAIGGKLVGAGGGGFLLFYTEEPERLIKAMPIKHIPFKYDFEGSKIL